MSTPHTGPTPLPRHQSPRIPTPTSLQHPGSAIPVHRYHATVLHGQKHHRWGRIDGRSPKIEVKLQRGEDWGCLACAVREQRNELRAEDSTRGSPMAAGLPPMLLAWSLYTRGVGIGWLHWLPTNPCLPQAPAGLNSNLGQVGSSLADGTGAVGRSSIDSPASPGSLPCCTHTYIPPPCCTHTHPHSTAHTHTPPCTHIYTPSYCAHTHCLTAHTYSPPGCTHTHTLPCFTHIYPP